MAELLAAALERIKEVETQLATTSASNGSERPNLTRSTQLEVSSGSSPQDGFFQWIIDGTVFDVFEKYTNTKDWFKMGVYNIMRCILLFMPHPAGTQGSPWWPSAWRTLLLACRQEGKFGGTTKGVDAGAGGVPDTAAAETPNGVASPPAPGPVKPIAPYDPIPELNELILKNREDRASEVPAVHVNAPKVEINWLTHKKEGMRLKRLMEESPDGRKFPHMQEMWNGSTADSWC